MAHHDNPSNKPFSPGDYIRAEVLDKYGLTHAQLAEHLGVTRISVSRLMAHAPNGMPSQGLSPLMALRLERATGTYAQVWMDRQTELDIWFCKRRFANDLMRIKPLGDPEKRGS